jgi:uncharacterized coiled-coil protein SlyX
MHEPSKHLTFRLAADDARLLSNRARAIGLSPGQLARLLVMQSLQNTPLEEIAQELTHLRDEVAELREHLRDSQEKFALAVEALLVDAGRAEPAKAAAWVRNNLLR